MNKYEAFLIGGSTLNLFQFYCSDFNEDDFNSDELKISFIRGVYQNFGSMELDWLCFTFPNAGKLIEILKNFFLKLSGIEGIAFEIHSNYHLVPDCHVFKVRGFKFKDEIAR